MGMIIRSLGCYYESRAREIQTLQPGFGISILSRTNFIAFNPLKVFV